MSDFKDAEKTMMNLQQQPPQNFHEPEAGF
jgi:hypothetical protein